VSRGVVAIAGTPSDQAAPVTLLWIAVIGTTVGIFVGTLTLKPKRGR